MCQLTAHVEGLQLADLVDGGAKPGQITGLVGSARGDMGGHTSRVATQLVVITGGSVGQLATG